jgi:hypothetical protein
LLQGKDESRRQAESYSSSLASIKFLFHRILQVIRFSSESTGNPLSANYSGRFPFSRFIPVLHTGLITFYAFSAIKSFSVKHRCSVNSYYRCNSVPYPEGIK